MRWTAPPEFVFVDECGTHVALPPLYAWAPRPQRAHGVVPRNCGQHRTLVAAADGLAFAAYVRGMLVSTLRPGQVGTRLVPAAGLALPVTASRP